MSTRLAIALIAVFSLTMPSCEKARGIAGKIGNTVGTGFRGGSTNSGGPPDQELLKLVRQSPHGLVFRKDLPFPNHIVVRTTRKQTLDGRFFRTSALGNEASHVTGTQTTITKLQRNGDEIRYELEKSYFATPTGAKFGKTEQESTHPLDLITADQSPKIFRRINDSWKADVSSGFRAALVSRQLAPFFEVLLTDAGLSPRKLWFSDSYLPLGHEIHVSSQTMPMLFSGNSSGALRLKLEELDAVSGHPCGRFSVTGTFTRKRFPDFDGNFTDEDITIQSGQLWLSLIYPLVLREEFQGIASFRTGGEGTPQSRGEGTLTHSLIRQWVSQEKAAR